MHTHASSLTPRRADRAQSLLDALGAWASGLCAAHCIALPVLVVALPGAGLEAFDSPLFDRGFAIFVVLFGAVVIGGGACLQRLRLVCTTYVLSVALLFAGAFAAGHGPRHAAMLALGGTLMAVAHLTNRSGVRRYGAPLRLLRLPFARSLK
jgi:hypothetical protein